MLDIVENGCVNGEGPNGGSGQHLGDPFSKGGLRPPGGVEGHRHGVDSDMSWRHGFTG